AGGLVATGRDAAAVARERERARELLTFLYSTPAYWPSLELFGWREVGERLHRLTREGKWGEMAGAITDEMLDVLVPHGTYAQIAAALRTWYGGLAPRLNFPPPARSAGPALRPPAPTARRRRRPAAGCRAAARRSRPPTRPHRAAAARSA